MPQLALYAQLLFAEAAVANGRHDPGRKWNVGGSANEVSSVDSRLMYGTPLSSVTGKVLR